MQRTTLQKEKSKKLCTVLCILATGEEGTESNTDINLVPFWRFVLEMRAESKISPGTQFLAF